jgi:hypothetical protein
VHVIAKIKLGVTVVGIRGTLGGITFSANKAGPFARIHSMGSNPRTAPQSIQRSNLATQAQSWRDVSFDDQYQWSLVNDSPPEIVVNSLGEIVALSGFQWFLKMQTRCQVIDQPTYQPVPTWADVPSTSGTNFACDDSPHLEMDLIPIADEETYTLIIWGTVTNSLGRIRKTANYKQIGYITPYADGVTDITAMWIAQFGDLITGQTIFVRTQIQRTETGQRGDLLTNFFSVPYPI